MNQRKLKLAGVNGTPTIYSGSLDCFAQVRLATIYTSQMRSSANQQPMKREIRARSQRLLCFSDVQDRRVQGLVQRIHPQLGAIGPLECHCIL